MKFLGAPMANAAPPPQQRGLIASVRHTVGLVLIMLALCLLGAYQQSKSGISHDVAPPPHAIISLYLSLIASEWALVLYVRAGTRRTGTQLRDLIGGRWRGVKDALRDVAIAAIF